MRHWFPPLFVLALLVAVPGVRAEGIEASGTLEIRSIIVPSVEVLRDRCRVSRHLYACTSFETRSLTTACRPSEDGRWRMQVTTRMLAVMYIWEQESLAHEKLHIADIELSLARYRLQLEQRRFELLTDCERTAAAEAASFSRQVEIFAAESSEKRDRRAVAWNHRRR